MLIQKKYIRVSLDDKDWEKLSETSSKLGTTVSTTAKIFIKHGISNVGDMIDIFESDKRLIEAIFLAKRLTTREIEILHLMIKGKSNKEISNEIKLEVKTVKNCITSILKKLSVKNRVQAILVAKQYNL